MTRIIRKTTLPLLFFFAFLLSFFAGRWTGRLQESLSAEANYPWDLHKNIGAINVNCEKLLSAFRVGDFIIETTDSGAKLFVLSYNRESYLVTASLLDSNGRCATDSWTIECR